jgi:hypothetical protein
MSALKKQNFRESSFGNTEQLSQLCCLMPRLGDHPSFSVLLFRAAQQGSAQFMMRGASDDRVEARWRTAPGRLATFKPQSLSTQAGRLIHVRSEHAHKTDRNEGGCLGTKRK